MFFISCSNSKAFTFLYNTNKYNKKNIVIVIKMEYKNKLDFVVFGEFVVVIRGVIVVVELGVVDVTSWHNLGITQSESNL